MEQPPSDSPPLAKGLRQNQDWLLAWFASTHSDIQWAKGQSWNAVQWSVLLLGAVYGGSHQFKHIWWWLWLIFAVLVGVVGLVWIYDLHRFAKSARDTSEQLIADLPRYLPPRRAKDPDHLWLLAAKFAVVGLAAILTVFEIARD